MAVHESLHEYYLHQHRNIVNYLELCLIHPEAELVHELRLSIKKLRAFHKLAEPLNKADGHVRIKSRVRKLYKAAGKLRDTQVQIELLARFEDNTDIKYPEFDKWLKTREKKQIKRFGKNPQHLVPQATAHSTHRKIGDLFATTDSVTISNCASEVLSVLYHTSRDLSGGRMNERNLHRIRTITKQMRYIINTMAHSYQNFKFEETSVDSLRDIEAYAGNWHDNLVRVELLDKFMRKMYPSDEPVKFKYQKFENDCNSELYKAYDEAILVVKKALHPEIQNLEV